MKDSIEHTMRSMPNLILQSKKKRTLQLVEGLIKHFCLRFDCNNATACRALRYRQSKKDGNWMSLMKQIVTAIGVLSWKFWKQGHVKRSSKSNRPQFSIDRISLNPETTTLCISLLQNLQQESQWNASRAWPYHTDKSHDSARPKIKHLTYFIIDKKCKQDMPSLTLCLPYKLNHQNLRKLRLRHRLQY